jgi:pyruvate dehydrogenase E2 component (dihydrolipoamide acetyltransferase)
MATRSFKLPDLGEGIHEGEVMAVHVSEGDSVQEDDPILEVETDKAAVDVPSPYTGAVSEVKVAVGDVIHVGDVVMVFEVAEAGAEPEAPEKTVKKAEKETLGQTEERAETVPEKPPASPKKGPVPASPATRKLAREKGVDLHAVTPTGKGGVVTREDVLSYAKKGAPAKPAEKAAPAKEPATPEPTLRPEGAQKRPLTVELPPLPDFTKWGPVDRKPVRSIRRATARQMALAWSQIPHVTSQHTVDITDLEAFRQKRKAKTAEQGGRLTLTVFAMKAVVAALKAFPDFNASLDTDSGEIILKRYYHIGVASDTEDGLIVPVIRDVDRKSITELAVELGQVLDKTRERKISVEDLQGGTFTITNIGPLGGGHFAPIINYPQVAIFGMGSARKQPVVRDTKSGRSDIVIRLMMPVVLTIDHRVLDGADAARFLNQVKSALEDPEELMMTMV